MNANANFPPGSAGRLTGFNKVPQAFLLALSPQAGSLRYFEITLALSHFRTLEF